MTTRTRNSKVMKVQKKVINVHKLNSKTYANSAAKLRRLVDRVLRPYGEPSMSLPELRGALDKQLRKRSLSDLVLKEREAGW